MKKYTITVNGVSYDVTVEEGGAAQSASLPPLSPAPFAAPSRSSSPKKTGGEEGAVKVTAPMPGKVLAVKKQVGDAVKSGDTILVLEAMKMENDIVAPKDGVIASLNVSSGDSVESGAVLASMN